jgi:rRNA-processing protein FCF1
MIDPYIVSLMEIYRHKGILIDTNILLLWFVGSVNRQRISKFNRTQQFTAEDYDILLRLLGYFSPKIMTTPNILTEVNSLANQLGEPERSQCFENLAEAAVNLNEHYLESSIIVKISSFNRFGLTDCSILELASDRYLVLTDDFKLTSHLQSVGINVINFNHLRTYLF